MSSRLQLRQRTRRNASKIAKSYCGLAKKLLQNVAKLLARTHGQEIGARKARARANTPNICRHKKRTSQLTSDSCSGIISRRLAAHLIRVGTGTLTVFANHPGRFLQCKLLLVGVKWRHKKLRAQSTRSWKDTIGGYSASARSSLKNAASAGPRDT
jgi:hypothetical protein